MKPIPLMIVPALAIALAITGCDGTSARGDYPDQSQTTRAEADAIRSDRERREQAIDRELQQTTTSLAFAKQQNANKARLERERITLERDQKIQPLEARRTQDEAKVKRDIERIDEESAAKLATVSGEEATRIRAEAASQIAEIKSKAAARNAEVEADIRAAKQDAQPRLANVEDGLAKEQADIAAKQVAAENKARDARLQVAKESTDKLDALARDSAKREKEHAGVVVADDNITKSVRENIVRHKDGAKDVTVTTDRGVVILSGTVANDAVRKDIIAAAGKVDGVVRVDDRISVR